MNRQVVAGYLAKKGRGMADKQESGVVSRQSARLQQALQGPTSRKTPLGTDSAWALKLKDAVDAAARELRVEVHTAKPVEAYGPSSVNDMRFEIDTDRGRVEAIRTKGGTHLFRWL